MSLPPVAFVVQRYGPSVTGGSEALARAVAERLQERFEITVFTTRAADYVSWRNELPAGEEQLGGVRVRRFPVEEERDLAAFNAFAEPLYVRERTHDEELEFLRRQGPCVPALVEALAAEADRYHAVVFFTYLYYPTYWGLRAAGERSVLVPTTHDEPPLRFSIYREVFARPRAFGFLTAAEERLVRERFPLGERPGLLVGMGIETTAEPEVAAFRRRHGLERPYALFAGRFDAGKGCSELLAFHEHYRRRHPGGAELVLIGKLAMPLDTQPGVRHLGFLPEDDKAAAMAGACALVCPSPYESLSIVLLEGFALGTPGLVNARSPVLQEHCLRSNAGLFYEDADEYAFALDLLARDAALRQSLSVNARRYVDAGYRWPVVLDRWRALVDAAARP
ncbi:MAG TPA: glycosyltransferase family 4 protein [Vicinamibacteria bacterium]|nr:glycosyltransferase family 4 protein [Vicinamibacteria bacterium]